LTASEPGGIQRLWRVFPWDPEAEPGTPYTASYIPAEQGSGRFDLGTSPVLYLAESAEHAVGETIQSYRGRTLRSAHLRKFGHQLALVAISLRQEVVEGLADLTDPSVLVTHGIRPDELAGRDTLRTQTIARSLHSAGLPGFRWWSSLSGDWHTTVLFVDRIDPASLEFSAPEPLALDHPALRTAAETLGVRGAVSPPVRRARRPDSER
jgi:hypothetical protein